MKKLALSMLVFLAPFLLVAQDYEEIKPNKLPKGVHSYVDKNMPGGTIIRAAKGKENEQYVYAAIIEIRNNKRIMIFDKDGNFLRRTTSLTGTPEPPPTKVNNTTKERSNMTIIPPKKMEPSELPPNIQKFLKDNHKNGRVLQAKMLTLGETPIFQIIYRDETTDNVYHFDAKGEYMKKRTYILKNSPFKHQYPITGQPTPASTKSTEEAPGK